MGATTRNLAGLHDVELARLAATGDRKAFGELVCRHGSAVRGLLRRMGADATLTDDLGQDAFLAAFEAISEFRGDGTFQAWVKRIAARLYLKRLKRSGLIQLAAGPIDPEIEGPAGPDQDHRIDLDEALRGLSAIERVCVSLCYGAGLSHAEAAEALNTPLGTVKSHVKRGLDKLRRRLGAPTEENGRQVHG